MIPMVNFTINAVHLLRVCCVLGMGPGSTLVKMTDRVPALLEHRLGTESMVSIIKQTIHNLVSVFNWILISTMEIMAVTRNH